MHSRKKCLYKAFLPKFIQMLTGFFPSHMGNMSNNLRSWKGNKQFLLGMGRTTGKESGIRESGMIVVISECAGRFVGPKPKWC